MIQITDITEKLERFGITDKLEQAHFLAQADHESAGFTKLTEGTNYRYKTAKSTFCGAANNPKSPSYQEHQRRLNLISDMQKTTNASDDSFVPQPWLFNLVYGSRMGNELNGIQDNDGFENRGLGIFQLTGYQNRVKFLDDVHKRGFLLNIDISNINAWLCTDNGAIYSAIWYWVYNNIKIPALKDDMNAVTKAINGGTNGLAERTALLAKYKKILGA